MYVYIVDKDDDDDDDDDDGDDGDDSDDDGDDDYDDDEDEDDDDDDDNDDKTHIRTGKSLSYLSIPLIHFYIYHATSSPTTGPMIGLTSFQFHWHGGNKVVHFTLNLEHMLPQNMSWGEVERKQDCCENIFEQSPSSLKLEHDVVIGL